VGVLEGSAAITDAKRYLLSNHLNKFTSTASLSFMTLSRSLATVLGIPDMKRRLYDSEANWN